MKIRHLTDLFAVSPQIQAKHASALADAGFVAVINNRPDGEMWGQPKGAAIEEACQNAGLKYHFIPISLRGLDPAQIERMKKVQAETDGKVLAFCNSGTRAANVWGLTQAGQMPVDEILAAGMKAGYNLHGLRPFLEG